MILFFYLQSLVNLLNVFSAFSAVYEAINFSSVTSTVSSFHTESGGDVDAKNWPSSIFVRIKELGIRKFLILVFLQGSY